MIDWKPQYTGLRSGQSGQVGSSWGIQEKVGLLMLGGGGGAAALLPLSVTQHETSEASQHVYSVINKSNIVSE